MSFRGDPQTTEEHIAYIYELLRRLRPLPESEAHNLLSPTHLDTDFAADKADGYVPVWNEEQSRWIPGEVSGGGGHTHDDSVIDVDGARSTVVVGGTSEGGVNVARVYGRRGIAVGDLAKAGASVPSTRPFWEPPSPDTNNWSDIAIGYRAEAGGGTGAIAIGSSWEGHPVLVQLEAAYAIASGVAIGSGTKAGFEHVAIGVSAEISDDEFDSDSGVAIGAVAFTGYFDGGFYNGSVGAVAVGRSANAAMSYDVAIGYNAVASNSAGTFPGGRNVVVGAESDAFGSSGVAVGYGAYTEEQGVTVGDGASNFTPSFPSPSRAIAIGRWTIAGDVGAIAIGAEAAADGLSSILIGEFTVDFGHDRAIVIGYGANISAGAGDSGVAVGEEAHISGDYGIAIGRFSDASESSVAVGPFAEADVTDGVAIGHVANVAHTHSAAIGANADTDANNQIMLGTSSDHVKTPGGRRVRITNTAIDLTLDNTHYAVTVDASGAARTITLPALSGRLGQTYRIKKIDSSANTVTIDGDAAENIDGATTRVLTAQYEAVDLVAGASEWHVY